MKIVGDNDQEFVSTSATCARTDQRIMELHVCPVDGDENCTICCGFYFEYSRIQNNKEEISNE